MKRYNIIKKNNIIFSFFRVGYSKESVIRPFRAFHDAVAIFAPAICLREKPFSLHRDSLRQGFQTSEDGATTLASHALVELGKNSA